MKLSIEQLSLLDIYSNSSFVNELFEHCKETFPFIFQKLGAHKLKVSLLETIRKGQASNITQRGPLQLYVDMSIVLGSGFDNDPMYYCFSSKNKQYLVGTELENSMHIHGQFKKYLADVMGCNNSSILSFKYKLSNESFDGFTYNNFNDEIFKWLNFLCPQKCMYFGSDKVREFIYSGVEYATERQFSFKVRAVFILILFIVGREFESNYFHLYDGFFASGKRYDDQDLILKSKEFLEGYVDSLII